MRKIGLYVVLLTLVMAGFRLHALAADKPKLPESAVAAAKDAPKIDGVLDDAVWKDATELKDLKDSRWRHAKGQDVSQDRA